MTMSHFEPITDREYLLNRLMMLSSYATTKLAMRLLVAHELLLLHPDFEAEANQIIDKLTFS